MRSTNKRTATAQPPRPLARAQKSGCSASAAKVRLTVDRIERASCPAGKDRTYIYDTQVPGLALKAGRTGHKSFFLCRRIKGRFCRVHLGDYPQIGLNIARQLAERLHGEIAMGGDPTATRLAAKNEMTLGEAYARYYEQHVEPHCAAKTQESVRNFWNYLSDWSGRKLSSISQAQVVKKHLSTGKKTKAGANRAVQLLGRIYRFNKSEANPAKGVTLYREDERERFLQPEEAPRFFKALNDEQTLPNFRDLVNLLIFTGARRGNVQAMQWDQISLINRTWTIPKTKNRRPATLHLSQHVADLLKRRQSLAEKGVPWVFPSHRGGHIVEPKKNWWDLLKRAKIENLTMHDLRRTFASWMAADGASEFVIAKVLGHVDTRTARKYARLNLEPVRRSVDRTTDAILTAANGQGGRDAES